MAFSDEDKQRIRNHLGYPSVAPAPSIVYGMPALSQTNFLVERAMELVLDVAQDRVRKLLDVLDNIECRMIDGQQYLIATQLDSLTLRADQLDKLEAEYCRWAARLADMLCAPLYPGAVKFRSLFMQGGAGSIPVRG